MNKCKRCLLAELADKDNVYAHVQKVRALLSKEEKATQEKYQERLSTCLKCDNLLEATCQKCGCYVEIRALKIDSDCPIKKW